MEECSEKECKYFKETYEKVYEVWGLYSFCTKQKLFIPDEKLCSAYSKSQKCHNCKHSTIVIYESGEIDGIDYHCKLQNDKMIYSDVNWAISNYAEFPECPIDKWEVDKT